MTVLEDSPMRASSSRPWTLLLLAAAVGCGSAPEQSPLSQPAAAPAPAPAPATAPAPPVAPAPGTSGLRAKAIVAPAVAGADVADRYTQMFYSGEVGPLFEHFSDEMKKVLPLPQLTERQAQFLEQFGRELALVHQESKLDGNYRAFVRWARFEKREGVFGVQWILRDDDSVAGFFVRAAQPTQ
jgi:hypothetical protein